MLPPDVDYLLNPVKLRAPRIAHFVEAAIDVSAQFCDPRVHIPNARVRIIYAIALPKMSGFNVGDSAKSSRFDLHLTENVFRDVRAVQDRPAFGR